MPGLTGVFRNCRSLSSWKPYWTGATLGEENVCRQIWGKAGEYTFLSEIMRWTRIFCLPSLVRSFRPSNWLFIIDKYSSVWYDDSEYFLKTLKISRWFIRHTFFIVPCCYCSIVTWFFGHMTTENEAIEFYSDDAIKIKFVKLWDLSQYSERTSSKWPTCQKLAFRGKLSRSLRY